MSIHPEDRRRELYALLGNLPPRDREIHAHSVRTTNADGYLLEELVLDLNGLEEVPALFVKPTDATGPFPCVLYNHAHGGRYDIGKTELIAGRKSLQAPSYAGALTARGYCALCIDTWCFGERQGRPEMATFKEMLWKGQVLWGMMVYDSLRAVDYLATRPEVDAQRIGTIGLSMGSTMAWWVAALDPRIRACVDICCLTDFDALIAAGDLDAHSIYYYVPSLLQHFTTAGINGLIAPRPHLSLAGNHDKLTPPAGLDRIDRELRDLYQSQNAAEAWQLLRYDCGHTETTEMRVEALRFLDRYLIPAPRR